MWTPLRSAAAIFAASVLGIFLSVGQSAFAQTVSAGQVLFTEFRLAGPGGFADEYMELYCNKDTDCDISAYVIVAFDPSFGDFVVTLPDDLVIPARTHLLMGDDFGYSLNTYAAPDLIASFNGSTDFFVDNEGFQLRTPDQNTVIDSVGFAGGGGTVTYAEGAGLQRTSGARPANQYAYVRKMGTATGGFPQDTNNNASDFVLISVTGTPHPGITTPVVLGAPGPQNLDAPVISNLTVPISLIEPNVAASAPPNRVRTGSGNSGTLSIRRSFTNNTGGPVGLLRFRVVDITTLNSPGYVQGGTQADLRLITSGNAETFVNSQGRTVVVRGTVLQFAGGTDEPNQPNGGGLNSTVRLPVSPGIPAGQTVDVQFLLNVAQTGTFRFYINIETLPQFEMGSPESDAGVVTTVTHSTPSRVPPRRLSSRRRL